MNPNRLPSDFRFQSIFNCQKYADTFHKINFDVYGNVIIYLEMDSRYYNNFSILRGCSHQREKFPLKARVVFLDRDKFTVVRNSIFYIFTYSSNTFTSNAFS